MTLKQFWTELESLGRVLGGDCKKWVKHHHIDRSVNIGEHCLITAVCKKLTRTDFEFGDYPEAARELGLDRDIAEKIVSAADNLVENNNFDPKYVNKILSIYGLKKKVKKNV